ncbi:hypothetical protein JW960_09175 [candidate division KSB1 bacterium]|nr:hypothetical protein [candidate division KSB1 bacterium]
MMKFLNNSNSSTPRRGNIVEVRPFHEIEQTLDENGQLDRMPFMPEMVQYCGQRFRVTRRVHYVCVDGNGMRGMNDTVTLENNYCDGSVHDGCQKACTLFWKTAWLKYPSGDETDATQQDKLSTTDVLKTRDEVTNKYICQSTCLASATCLLTRRLKPVFLAKELFSGNQRFDKFLTNFGHYLRYKLANGSTNSVCHMLKGKSDQAPRESLKLKAGDWVEVKTPDEIAGTLDTTGKNHGLVFTSEMHHFCGKRYQVRQRLDKMVSETSGQMVKLRDTVLLENVTCFGICKFGCSRQLFHYWREIWLKKIDSV